MPAPLKASQPKLADVLRLGSAVATAKAQTNPNIWSQFVKQTHASGFTVAGALSGVPDPLKERTNASLVQQAQSSAANAFKPVLSDLNQQQTRIQAWDAKRASDNKVYEQWLASQNANLLADQERNAGALTAAQNQAAAATSMGWPAAQAASQQALTNTPGTVSDFGQSNALNYSAPAAKDNQLQAVTNAVGAQTSAANNQLTNQLAQASLGQQAAHDAQSQANTATALRAVFDARTKATIDQASQSLSELTHLQDQEISKASSNRDYAAAAQKLDIQAQDITARQAIANAANKTKISLANAANKTKTDIANANRIQTAADRAAQRVIDQARIREQAGKGDLNNDGKVDATDYKLKKSIDKKYGITPSTTPSASDKRLSAGAQDTIASISSTIRHLRVDKKWTPARVKQYLRTPQGKNGVKATDDQINVAIDYYVHNGKIVDPANQQLARAMGMIVAADGTVG